MEIAKQLWQQRLTIINKERGHHRSGSYYVVIHYDDFRKLSSEHNVTLTECGYTFEDFVLYRTEDIEQGVFEIF